MEFRITPIPKPRMTRADAWKKRPCVQRYWLFKDELNLQAQKMGFDASKYDVFSFMFHLPMPDSWSAKKKSSMIGKPHKQKPDLDNLIKAVADCLLEEDSHIWGLNATKLWTDDPVGKIIITV